jgi:hypothetical protein
VIAGNIERVCKRLQKVLKPEQKRDGACDAPTLPGDRNDCHCSARNLSSNRRPRNFRIPDAEVVFAAVAE